MNKHSINRFESVKTKNHQWQLDGVQWTDGQMDEMMDSTWTQTEIHSKET